MAFKMSSDVQPQLHKFVEDYHYAKNSPNHSALSSQDGEFSSSNNEDDTNKDSLKTIPSSEIKRMFSRRQNRLQSRFSQNLGATDQDHLNQEQINTAESNMKKEEQTRPHLPPPVTVAPKSSEAEPRGQSHKVEFVESSTPMRSPYLNASVSAQRAEKKDEKINQLEKTLQQYKAHLDELQQEMHSYREVPSNRQVPKPEPQSDNLTARVKLCGAGERILDETDFGSNYYTLYMDNLQNVSWVGATNSLKNILNKFGITYDELRGYIKFLGEDEVQFIQDLHQELHGRPLKLNRQNRDLMHDCFKVMLEEVHRLRIRAERDEERR
ncbi:hypothetical protein HII12_000856 [Brettanomyces bruxellensis]|uniref:Uncharacterized protein n=1 Tax=Dekkera bruxellensis TaxID=5007 RepID=A0A8H6BQG3_DEKBR|nr:hypothetical protein HII12_000856 [Brettanomyces bruxellensis]